MEIAQIISDRTSSEILSCGGDIPVRNVIAMLAQQRIGAMPVIEGGEVAGIFSERDVIYRLAEEGPACLDRPVRDVMTAPAITITPSTKVDEALSLMTKRRIRHLPVVDGAVMCGFISIGDLVKSRFDQIETEAKALRDYISTA